LTLFDRLKTFYNYERSIVADFERFGN